jgi:ribosome-associated heat shock protein Hsp15
MDEVRIDKWLWAARFFKTRSLATDAVLGGHVQLNGVRVKPAKDVRAGDKVDVRVGTQQWSLVVTGVSEKRGPAIVARTLYEETPESAAAREAQTVARRLSRPLGADLGERPTKQARRRLDALRRNRFNAALQPRFRRDAWHSRRPSWPTPSPSARARRAPKRRTS